MSSPKEQQLAIKKLPDYQLKQKILYIDRTSPEILKNYGDLFFAEGNVSDALDFYQKANYIEGIQKIKDAALESGDVMLFGRAAKTLNEELKPADWEKIGRIALNLKKYLFARHALEKANNEELLNSLKQILQAEGYEEIS
jgi:tetratricopeptide (TPR) repeat protein